MSQDADGPAWDDYRRFVGSFLRDCPEYEADVAWCGDPPELCMRVRGLQAFVRWTLAQGMVPEDRLPVAYAALSRLKDMEHP